MKLPKSAITPEQVTSRSVGEEVVILDVFSGTYFGLNPVGACIWQHISDGKTFAEICDLVIDEYEVTRQVFERDIFGLIQELEGRGLLIVAE